MLRFTGTIVTDETITMAFNDGTIKEVKKSHPNFEEVKEKVMANNAEGALNAFDVAYKLSKHASGEFYVYDGVVYLDADNPVPMPQALSDRVIQFADARLKFSPLIKFWENIQRNPNQEAVKDLYDFLCHNGIPITEDGMFVAYKRVSENFESINAGVWEKVGERWELNKNKHYDNSIGQRVEMPRSEVDSDREIACSSGLHVAAFNYANDFYYNGKLVLVKIDPADVVSVPVDYNQEKMRTCGYWVMEEVDGPRENEPLYNALDDHYLDEDVFNEDIDEDVFDEDVFDEDIEEEDIEEVLRSPDKSGRICIPSSFVRKLGLHSGRLAGVHVFTGSITIFNKDDFPGDDFDFEFVVDRDSNIRLTKRVMTRAFLNDIPVKVIFDNSDTEAMIIITAE